MSASAIKSSMSGVGASPPAPAHSIMPMNVMAQKVPAPGGETGSMKPMSVGGLSYVTLQPANQPLSLVQDHRPASYQNAAYSSNSAEKEKEKEPEPEKIVQNGVELVKATTVQEPPASVAPLAPVSVTGLATGPPPAPKQQIDGNRNNNQSPENAVQVKQDEAKPVSDSVVAISEFTATVCPPAPTKIDEKKTTPVKNGSKPETVVPVVAQPIKIPPHKPEEQTQMRSAEIVTMKAKPSVQSLIHVVANATSSVKPTIENPSNVSAPKIDQKITSTPRTVKRKSRELKDLKGGSGEGGSKPKRNRVQTQPYQSPLPEIALIVKTLSKAPPSKNADDKLIVFYKNEFLAVRNAEGSFYVCQAMQNIYKSSRRIRIRWLSQDKNNGEIYSPDFYDFTDFDCILTNLNLNKIDKNKFQLTKFELLRTENILKRAIDVEAGVSEKPRVTEEHPDGLDLSLYKDESQLKRRKRAAKAQRLRKRTKQDSSSSEESSSSDDEETPKKSSPKLNRVKKGSMNKALAIAKSVAKGPNRAKRALNRAAVVNKPVAPVTVNSVTSSSTEAVKRNNPDTNKKIIEPKKIINKPQTTIASVAARSIKLRGTPQQAPESSSSSSTISTSTIVRAKRLPTVTAITVPAASTQQSTEESRKKLRTTRA